MLTNGLSDQRTLKMQHVESVEEGFREGARADAIEKPHSGAGHNTQGVIGAPPQLKRVEQDRELLLHGQRHPLDVIQKHSPAVCRVEQTQTRGAEKVFISWEVGDVDANERAVRARAALMDSIGNGFDCGWGGRADEHRRR